VVTGASSGIGLATATSLAQAGATVILAVRNSAKGETAAQQIQSGAPRAQLEVEHIDLGSLASIAEFADRVGAQPLNLLINNAGLSSADPAETTADGFDLQVGVNYLGAYALTCRLWSALIKGPGRVVMLGSMMAKRGEITEALGSPSGSTYRSYSDSKLATVVFAVELRRLCSLVQSPVTAVAAHPGWAQTAIFDTAGPPPIVESVGTAIGALQSAADGSQPILLAATAVDPAPYYGPVKRFGAAGPAAPVPLPDPATVAGIGPRLWEISQRLTGCHLRP
jgi:NAD(P)-dependent dehydrogenase (short-subunit alcohol dehydrogenase family)